MKTILKLFILISLASCGKSEIKGSVDQSVRMFCDVKMSSPSPANASDSRTFNADSKIIRTGTIVIVAENVESTKCQLNTVLKRCNGHSTYEDFNSSERNSSYKLQFQVPATNFELFLSLIDSLKLNITERTLYVRDVTSEYIDETTRLDNKRKLEQKYIDILSKAKTVDDIIKINTTIEEIRSDIESREAQLKRLEYQVALSGFEIRIDRAQNLDDNSNSSTKFDSLKRFKGAVLDGFEGLNVWMEFFISIWPLYILFIILFFPGRIILKKYRRRNNTRIDKD